VTPRRHSLRHVKCVSASVRRRSSVKGRNRRRLVDNLARSEGIPHNVVTCHQRVVIANRIVARGLAKMTSTQRHDAATQMTDLVEPLRPNKIGSAEQRATAPPGTIAVSVAKVGPPRIEKELRLASVVRPRAVTSKVNPLELAPQVVADRPGPNATSKHRAHHETSALR